MVELDGVVGGRRPYQAYLLRLWQENPDGAWRFMVQSVATGERRAFTDLDHLLLFLQRAMGERR